MARQVLGFSVTVVRTDGDGELWGSKDFRRRVFEDTQVIVEPMGGKHSAANGKAEQAIGMLGIQAQLLLYAAGLKPIFWCFVLLHATTLSNIKPRSEGRMSPHIELFNTPPNLTSLRIFGSPIYRVDRRVTRCRPDSATKKGIWLGLHGKAEICVYMDTLTQKFGYAHHYIVDELDLNQLPGNRNPAAKLLAGHPLPLAMTEQIKTSLMEVEPGISPWLTDTLVNNYMDGMPWSRTFGFLLTLHQGYGQLRVESLIPGSFVYDYLKDNHVEGLFLLAINGIELGSLTDIMAILDDMFNQPEPAVHTIMTGFTFLFGKLDATDTDVDQLSSEEHYHVVSCSVFSLCLEAIVEDTDTQDILNDLACLFLDMDDVDPDFIDEIWSILQTASDPKCPQSFSAALKEPVHQGKWIAAFYKHLDSCYALGTYGCPKIPPADATVLPAVVVLKLVLNQLKQAAAHKIQVCVNGGLQIQGKDYDKSYAHIILSQSLKIIVAVGCCLSWLLFHFDIHNAFQSTPDDGDIHGNRSWLHINNLWLEYIQECKPDWWPQVQSLFKKHSVEELAVEVCKFVQGHVDASQKWGEHVEEVIFKELGLLPNRADPAVYSGIFQGHLLSLVEQQMISSVPANTKAPTKLSLLFLKRIGLYMLLVSLIHFLDYTLCHQMIASLLIKLPKLKRSLHKYLAHHGKLNIHPRLFAFP